MDDAHATSPINYAKFQHRLMNNKNPAKHRSKHTQKITNQIFGQNFGPKTKKAKEIKQIVQQARWMLSESEDDVIRLKREISENGA